MRLDPILPFAPSALLPLHHDGARLEAEIQAAHAHKSEEREVAAPRAVEKQSVGCHRRWTVAGRPASGGQKG